MIPKKTDWTNIVMGEGQDHVLPCPAHKESNGDVTVAMDLTDEEVAAIVKNKTVYLRVCTYNRPMQPFNMWATDEEGNYIDDERIPK